jgi:acetyl-CoA acetyltransferase
MREVAVIGAGMTRFGKHMDRSMKDLAREAIEAALHSAGVAKEAVEAAAVGNAVAGLITGKNVFAVRWSCAIWASEAFRSSIRKMLAPAPPPLFIWRGCTSLPVCTTWCLVGMEKLFHPDKKRTFEAIGSAIDLEIADEFARRMSGEQSVGAGESRSVFMDLCQSCTATYGAYGTTKEQFARIAAKNHSNGSLNPHANIKRPYNGRSASGAAHR